MKRPVNLFLCFLISIWFFPSTAMAKNFGLCVMSARKNTEGSIILGKLRRILAELIKNLIQNPLTGLRFFFKNLPFWLRGQMLFAHPNTIIRNSKNLHIHGNLYIGQSELGFMHDTDLSLLNIRGEMHIYGNVNIGKGCRFDIMKVASCTLSDCGITGASTFIIRHSLIIEEGVRISWNCQFLDDDFHTPDYAARKSEISRGINIGKNVWVGSHVLILKNVTIGEGSIIGAGAVVTRSMPQHILAAGNPARIVREDVNWNK